MTQAISGASGALLPGLLEDDDLDFLDDPLGGVVPWEEKFSKEARAKERRRILMTLRLHRRVYRHPSVWRKMPRRAGDHYPIP